MSVGGCKWPRSVGGDGAVIYILFVERTLPGIPANTSSQNEHPRAKRGLSEVVQRVLQDPRPPASELVRGPHEYPPRE